MMETEPHRVPISSDASSNNDKNNNNDPRSLTISGHDVVLNASIPSTSHSMASFPFREEHYLTYPSHESIHICSAMRLELLGSETDSSSSWNVHESLRSSLVGSPITAFAVAEKCDAADGTVVLCAGHSNGGVSAWHSSQEDGATWKEVILCPAESSLPITSISGIYLPHEDRLWISCATCDGIRVYSTSLITHNPPQTWHIKKCGAVFSVSVHWYQNEVLIFIGTAHPFHNRIAIYSPRIDCADPRGFRMEDRGSLYGHEDWITSFAFCYIPEENVHYLASASHDCKIRLWKFGIPVPSTDDSDVTDNVDEDEDVDVIGMDDDSADMPEELDEDSETARLILHHGNLQTPISLESILFGHDESVTNLSWHPHEKKLLSSSMDKSIFVWYPDSISTEDEIWIPQVRVGSAGGILGGSLGSSLLGYQQAIWRWDGLALWGCAYGGAVHYWESTKEDQDIWEAKSSGQITGHFRDVVDLSFSEHGDYLLTVSKDQTCRMWMPCCAGDDKHTSGVWREVGRPQVHGYNLECVVSLRGDRMVSGAEEKVLRVFEAPKRTIRIKQFWSSKNSDHEQDDTDPEENTGDERAECAFVPTLGLSNKGEGEGDDTNEEQNIHNNDSDPSFLPLDQDLGVSTLWPETNKLYGHGSELMCLASLRTPPPSSTNFPIVVASACKARDPENASIRLWDILKGKCIAVLHGGHKSTVASLSFSSPNETEYYLASGGKDRRLCLWKCSFSTGVYELFAAVDGAHKRIIWSVEIFPKFWDGLFEEENILLALATCGRDGLVKIWICVRNEDSEVCLKEVYRFEPKCKSNASKSDPITSLSIFPKNIEDNKHSILAIGMESGYIEVWSVPPPVSSTPIDEIPHMLYAVPVADCHTDAVKTLAWKPQQFDFEEGMGVNDGDLGEQNITLGSCGLDGGVRIINFKLS